MLSVDPTNTVGPVLGAAKCICSPISRKLNDLWELDSNVKNMNDKYNQLSVIVSDIETRTEIAKEQGRTVINEVSLWLDDCATAKSDVGSVKDDIPCFLRRCGYLKLAEDVIKFTENIQDLLERKDKLPSEVAVEQSSSLTLPFPDPKLVVSTTVQKNIDEILGALRNPDCGIIGIHAMGGSGKTATLTHINYHLAGRMFNKIIWVTLSRDMDPNTLQLQDIIAEHLNLDLSIHKEEVDRARLLSQRLKKINKFLIIFDNMWKWFHLNTVGIPKPDRENECKIVITTREKDVCRHMETNKYIAVKLLLSIDEAWDFFVSKTGIQGFTLEVEELARQLVHKCGGLPLAIQTLARAMTMRGDDNIRVWRKALNDMKNSPKHISGMNKDVFEVLRISYDSLENDQLRKCFLYFGLFPEDYEFEAKELIRYWTAERFITEHQSLDTEIDNGFGALDEIVDRCMCEKFLSANGTNCVRVHGLFKNLATEIMGQEGGLLGKISTGLATPQNGNNQWENSKIISLMNPENLKVLPQAPNCPNLSTLLFHNNHLSKDIPSSFFDNMPLLQILDLSHTSVSQLPLSPSNLNNLHSLFLQGCKSLVEIPSLANLEKLQTLNLSRTSIKKLPPGMEGLTSLRSLDLSFTIDLESCLMPNLTLLEEFHLQGSYLCWMDPATISDCIQKISCLNSLSILTMSFLKLDDYLVLMGHEWDRLVNFFIETSDLPHMSQSAYSAPLRSVHVRDQKKKIHGNTPLSALLLPANTQDLHIEDSEIPPLSSLSCLKDLEHLSKCHIESCTLSGDNLIVDQDMQGSTFTTRLEYLRIISVSGLAVFWKGVVSRPNLEKLKRLEVSGCQALKNLFFISLFQYLANIEIIKVKGCNLLKEIVTDDQANAITTVTPPKLHTLVFEGLTNLQAVSNQKWVCESLRHLEVVECPRLKQLPFSAHATSPLRLHTLIFKRLPEFQTISNENWVCESLRHVEVVQCPRLERLPFSVDSLSNAKIIGETQWWDALKWDDANTKSRLQSRFEQAK